MARRKSFDWFVPALGLAIILALVLPEPGGKHGPLHAEILNKIGVALIFFLHGANLSFGALKAGAMRWQLHTVVQVCVFVLFPFMGLGLWYLLGGRIPEDLRIGFMFLCALPSTVSSSVALTGIAHGNVAGAIFNATISSIIGIFVTPLWMAGVLHTQGQSLNLGDVILDLVIWLLIPLIVGQVLRPWIGQFVHRHKKVLSLTDRLVILFLVYSSFCDSVLSGVWKGKGPDLIGLALGGGIVMFVLALIVTNFISRTLKFSEEDRIAAVFCGSKKSLAAGVPMANILFAGHPGLGLILLPTILYHASQLIICSWLARRWANRPGIDHSQSH